MSILRRVPRRLWFLLAVMGGTFAAATWLRGAADLEWSARSVRETVDGFGGWAPAILIAMLAFRYFFLIPSQFLLAAGGLLFGTVAGTLYGAVGLTLASVIQYLIVHWAGVEGLRARFPERLRGALALARSRGGAGALIVASAYPAGPVTVVQLSAVIAGMNLMTFAACVAAGSVVRAGTFAFFGSTLVQGDRILIGGLVVLAAGALPLLHPRTRAWLRQGFSRSEVAGASTD